MKYFEVKILIDGQDLESLGLRDKLSSFAIFQDENKIDLFVVDFLNKFNSIGDSNIFRNKAKIDVFLSNEAGMTFIDSYYLIMSKNIFSGSAMGITRVIAMNDIYRLKESGKKRKAFRNSKDSEIANQIALQYQLSTADIEDSTLRRIQENQLDETDLAFLSRLAKRNGYLLYIENKSLHFHPIKSISSGISFTYGDESSDLIQFESGKCLLGKVNTIVATILDKNTGMILQSLGVDTPDAFQKDELANNSTFKNAATEVAPRPFDYSNEFDPSDNILAQKKQVDKAQQLGLYVVRSFGKMNGDPKVKARTTIEVNGIGNHSGLYYLKTVVHKYSEEGYITEFVGIKSRYGNPKQSPALTESANPTNPYDTSNDTQPTIIAEVSQ